MELNQSVVLFAITTFFYCIFCFLYDIMRPPVLASISNHLRPKGLNENYTTRANLSSDVYIMMMLSISKNYVISNLTAYDPNTKITINKIWVDFDFSSSVMIFVRKIVKKIFDFLNFKFSYFGEK